MRIMEKIAEDRRVNSHTNSAQPIDENLTLERLQKAFPDCRVYVKTMVTGIYDKKTYAEQSVRRDLKKFVENPRVCIVVDWSSV